MIALSRGILPFLIFVVTFALCGAGGGLARAAEAGAGAPYAVLPASDSFVNLTADELVHDDAAQTVTASGHVEFIYDERILKADRVVYHLATEIVTVDGDVVMMDRNGDVHFADQAEVTRDMKNGFVKALRSTLSDGSRFTAVTGQRTGGRYVVMRNATYTPCIPCKSDPSRPPTWMIHADRVTHDTEEHSVTYNKAWMEMGGVPMFYIPYFSHPDGTIKQKSGFLTPIVRMSSQNGQSVLSRYYWAVDPSRDATLGLQAFTKQAPRVSGEYRQRFDQAEVKIDGSVTYSKRRVTDNNQTVITPEELRSHLFAESKWDMTDKWRSGINIELASDPQYLRQYGVLSKDVLENEIFAERFDGRDYAVVRGLAFQDVRTSDRRTDQPNILPEAQARFYGAPATFFGGRFMADTSFLGLERSDGGDDMTRMSGALSWQRRDVTPFGLVTTTDLMSRGDIYYAVNRNDNSTTDKNKTRLFPLANVMTSYPLTKPVAPDMDMIVEPIVSVTLVPRLDRQNDIPNEDSGDSQLDSSNLFNPNRFPGLDRVEDQSRVTYGGRTSLNWHDGRIADLFLGQSYRFEDESNNFPVNSGLSDQKSDYVGRMRYIDAENFSLDYGIQLDGDSFNSVRHEIDNRIKFGKFSIDTGYLFAKTIEGVGVTQSREQIRSNVSYRFDEDWQARIGGHYDLGEDQGLRKSIFGIDYLGQCVTFSTTIERKLTEESSGDSGTELMVRLGLKNLGEFQTSGIGLSSQSSDNDTVN